MDRDELLRGIETAAQRARWTRVLLVLVAMVCVASALQDLILLDFLGRVQAQADFTEAEGDALDQRTLIIMWTGAGLAFCALITWLMWVHRAVANLRLAGSGISRFTPGWSVGWYFVPVLNVFRVWSLMHDLAARSADGNARAEDRASRSGIVSAWWVLFWISRTAGRLVGKALAKAEDVDEISRYLEFSVATDTLLAVAAGLAWLVVRRIDRLQREVLVLAPPVPA